MRQVNCWDWWLDDDFQRWRWISGIGFIFSIFLVFESVLRLMYHSVVVTALLIPSIASIKYRDLLAMHIYFWTNYLDYLFGFSLASVPILGMPYFYFLVIYHGDELGAGTFYFLLKH